MIKQEHFLYFTKIASNYFVLKANNIYVGKSKNVVIKVINLSSHNTLQNNKLGNLDNTRHVQEQYQT